MANFYIASSVLRVTEDYLRAWGRKSLESLVLWGGRETAEGDYSVVTCYIPKQQHLGASVEVEENSMQEILSQLYHRKQALVAQVHTHPPGILHLSDIDRVRVPIHREGFIHIIVPDYCTRPLDDLLRCLVYEYLREYLWRPLASEEIRERFIIDDHKVEA